MSLRLRTISLFIVLSLLSVGCSGKTDPVVNNKASTTQASKCSSNQDQDGYLEKICLYIKKNKIKVSPGDPANYQIQKISEIKYQGKPVYLVALDCCYLGDEAYFDKQTKQIIYFQLGAK